MHSRSQTGTKKSSSFIDTDSTKYVQRNNLGMTKRGSAKDDTQSSHIFSWGLLNAISTNTGGRPMGESHYRELCRDMSDNSNLRLKTSHSNQVLDERRDARIADAFVNGHSLTSKTAADRAYQAYQSASSFTTMDSYAQQLGDLKV